MVILQISQRFFVISKLCGRENMFCVHRCRSCGHAERRCLHGGFGDMKHVVDVIIMAVQWEFC